MSEKISVAGGFFCIVDRADFAELSKYRWHICGSRGAMYVARSRRLEGKTVCERMHNLLLATGPGLVVDHVNGNHLDNRRCNLRACTRSENQWNRHAPPRGASRFTGVSPERGRWRARITCHSRCINIGHFAREVDAAIAYDEKCRELRGGFARPNLPLALGRGELRDWVSRTGGHFFSVCFIKRTDGSERVMLCRTGVRPLPGPSIIDITEVNELLSVWDVQARDFRFVPLEGILWVRYKNIYIRPLGVRRAALDATTQGLLFARTAG